MSLTEAQMNQLAEAIDRFWDLPTLRLFARDELEVDLANLAPDGSVKDRALKLITTFHALFPPQDVELLSKLILRGNAQLRRVAKKLLTHDFFPPPPAQPLDAIVIGPSPFVAREKLRDALQDFIDPDVNKSHVIFVQGAEPCGKSYSWQFLRHLAQTHLGIQPLPLRLRNRNYTPREFFERIFVLLGLDTKGLPPLLDDPQLARMDSLIDVFSVAIAKLPAPQWLVIDDLNDATVTPAILDAAYAIACAVEDVKPKNLWLVLIGYNKSIVGDEFVSNAGHEEAEFPSPEDVAEHLVLMAKHSPNPLATDKALEAARVMYSAMAQPDKAEMIRIAERVRLAGEAAMLGQPMPGLPMP